jgi:hypothetical protein
LDSTDIVKGTGIKPPSALKTAVYQLDKNNIVVFHNYLWKTITSVHREQIIHSPFPLILQIVVANFHQITCALINQRDY